VNFSPLDILYRFYILWLLCISGGDRVVKDKSIVVETWAHVSVVSPLFLKHSMSVVFSGRYF